MKCVLILVVTGILTISCGFITSNLSSPTETPAPTSTVLPSPTPFPTRTPEVIDLPELPNAIISENPGSVVLLKRLGTGKLNRNVSVYSVSSDANQLAFASGKTALGGTIQLLSLETGEIQQTLEQAGDVRLLQYIFDGRLLVFVSGDGIIRFWAVP